MRYEIYHSNDQCVCFVDIHSDGTDSIVDKKITIQTRVQT